MKPVIGWNVIGDVDAPAHRREPQRTENSRMSRMAHQKIGIE